MSDLISQTREYADLSEVVTATYYDEEHEEWSVRSITIKDVLDAVCDDYTVLSLTLGEKKSNLIDRQAAVDAIIAEGRTVDSRYLESERIIHESDAVEAISMLQSVQQWISVNKGLPKDMQKVLISTKEGNVWTAVWGEAENLWFDDYDETVIAWMPLPEPFEGGDANESKAMPQLREQENMED